MRPCWLLLLPGPGRWRWTRAEAPCWKGEAEVPCRWWHVVVGWQGQERGHDEERGNDAA